MTRPIFHIASRDAWLASAEKGAYCSDSLSVEGFIHCSTSSQIVMVANAFYRGQEDLVLLVIDPDKLVSELRWEPPAEPKPGRTQTDERYPHVYGAIDLDAVAQVLDFEPGPHGDFILPAEVMREK